MRRAILLLAGAALSGCVLDRTGRSASEIYRRELALQGARVGNLEDQFDKLDARVSQLEELNRARGQEEILKMQTLDQVRQEVARLRGEVEVLRHDFDTARQDGTARAEDAAYRLQWLEARADQLEAALGLEAPPPPEREVAEAADDTGQPAAAGEDGAGQGDGAEESAQAVTDPDEMIALAEQHLAAGREKAAIAVLDRFLKLHPDHPRVPEALYRRAEAEFNQGNYSAAVLRFQDVIDRNEKSPWAAWAMLRQGECFDEQGKKDEARLFYEDVARKYPKSKAAREARQKLGR